MASNDDFYGKELNLNCFYMHTNFGQKYLKTAIVYIVRFLTSQDTDSLTFKHKLGSSTASGGHSQLFPKYPSWQLQLYVSTPSIH